MEMLPISDVSIIFISADIRQMYFLHWNISGIKLLCIVQIKMWSQHLITKDYVFTSVFSYQWR